MKPCPHTTLIIWVRHQADLWATVKSRSGSVADYKATDVKLASGAHQPRSGSVTDCKATDVKLASGAHQPHLRGNLSITHTRKWSLRVIFPRGKVDFGLSSIFMIILKLFHFEILTFYNLFVNKWVFSTTSNIFKAIGHFKVVFSIIQSEEKRLVW